MGLTRTFPSGATRDTDEDKLDYSGFLSPIAISTYAQYMHEHRVQSDGELRSSDNWQKGLPEEEVIKSLWRHNHDVWSLYLGYVVYDRNDGHEITKEEALCAALFNNFVLLHQLAARKVTEIPPKPQLDLCCICFTPLGQEDRQRWCKTCRLGAYSKDEQIAKSAGETS